MNTKYHLIQVPNVQKVGIYAIRNKVNNKYYIGSSVNVNARMKSHRSNIEKLNGSNLEFDKDLQSEDDIKNFEFIVLETFEDYQITDLELRKKEAEYIEKYNAYKGYNNPDRHPTINGYFCNNEYLFCKKQGRGNRERILALDLKKTKNIQLIHLYANMAYKAKETDEDIKTVEVEILERMNK